LAHFLRVATITKLVEFHEKKCTNAVIAALVQPLFPI
jgi:hypothetical protein